MKATDDLRNEHEGIELMLRILQAIAGKHEEFHELLHRLEHEYLDKSMVKQSVKVLENDSTA